MRNGWEALKVPCHQRRASPSLRSWKGRHASVVVSCAVSVEDAVLPSQSIVTLRVRIKLIFWLFIFCYPQR